MRRIFLCLFLILPATAWAQSGRISVDIPQSLAAKAAESVDVTLDGTMLHFAAKFLSDDEDRATREMVQKLEGIYVHHYEFDHEGEYDRSILDKVRSQLGPSWKRIVNVQNRMRENTEIYTQVNGDTISGLVILAAEPRQLTIVNIVGPVDLDKLASLEGQFGIPHVTKEETKEQKRQRKEQTKEDKDE